MQLDLFPSTSDKQSEYTRTLLDSINGLSYLTDFISCDEEDLLIETINGQPWLNDLKRRVQHYGYKYDYKTRSIDNSLYVGQLPSWSMNLCKRLVEQKLMSIQPDQIIVNEYLPGQGISNHIDCEPCFDDTIISLSLGSTASMKFIEKKNSANQMELLLARRSLVVLTGDSRYNWSHGIPAREKDKWLEKIYPRQTRISLTFRKVKLL